MSEGALRAHPCVCVRACCGSSMLQEDPSGQLEQIEILKALSDEVTGMWKTVKEYCDANQVTHSPAAGRMSWAPVVGAATSLVW